MEKCVEIKECIACGSTDLYPLLDLGEQPLANGFLKSPNDPEEKYPLATNYCKNCYHVQLTHKVHPDLIFKDYPYVSGTSKTQLEYFDWFARYVTEADIVGSVLDIGCNDGSQLDAFKKLEPEIKTYGVDPAKNLYGISSKKHTVFCEYFGEPSPIRGFSYYDAIICQNAFAHNYDQLALLKNMKKQCGGLIYITTSQADMITNGEFDTIYHEHLSYYTIRSMNELCKRAGASLVEVLKHPIHGNSFIFVISPNKLARRDAYIEFLMKEEEKEFLYDDSTYFWYKSRVEQNIKKFRRKIAELKLDYKVIGYGAPAKGNTLLNAAGVSLDFIIDDNPLKQGLYTPGRHIPVFGSEKLEEVKNENVVFVPLAWNFFDEIKGKIKALRPDTKDLYVHFYPYVSVEGANEWE